MWTGPAMATAQLLSCCVALGLQGVSRWPTVHTAHTITFPATRTARPYFCLDETAASAAAAATTATTACSSTGVSSSSDAQSDERFRSVYAGVLPHWLVSRTEELGFVTPTPVQAKALPRS